MIGDETKSDMKSDAVTHIERKIFELGGIPASPKSKIRVARPSSNLTVESKKSQTREIKSGNSPFISKRITSRKSSDFQKKQNFFEGFLSQDRPECGQAQQNKSF